MVRADSNQTGRLRATPRYASHNFNAFLADNVGGEWRQTRAFRDP
jgi:hypothetical protein